MNQFIAALVLCLVLASRAAASDTLQALKKTHDEASAKLDLSSKVSKEKLDRAYLDALEVLQEKYRKASDLDRLLPVKKEADRFTLSPSISPQNLVKAHAELLDLQKKYVASNSKLRLETKNQRLELLRDYGTKLTEAKIALTKANQIDDAVAVEAERKKIAAKFTALKKGDAPKIKLPPNLDRPTFKLPVKELWPYKTDVKKGEKIHIKASGYWRVLRNGKKRGPGDKTFYLAGRIDGGEMFRVGKEYTLEIEKDGTLELTMWEGGKYSNNSGKITVELTRTNK